VHEECSRLLRNPVVVEQVRVDIECHGRLGVAQHPLRRFHVITFVPTTGWKLEDSSRAGAVT
jgi:hypothetical protein